MYEVTFLESKANLSFVMCAGDGRAHAQHAAPQGAGEAQRPVSRCSTIKQPHTDLEPDSHSEELY